MRACPPNQCSSRRDNVSRQGFGPLQYGGAMCPYTLYKVCRSDWRRSCRPSHDACHSQPRKLRIYICIKGHGRGQKMTMRFRLRAGSLQMPHRSNMQPSSRSLIRKPSPAATSMLAYWLLGEVYVHPPCQCETFPVFGTVPVAGVQWATAASGMRWGTNKTLDLYQSQEQAGKTLLNHLQ